NAAWNLSGIDGPDRHVAHTRRVSHGARAARFKQTRMASAARLKPRKRRQRLEQTLTRSCDCTAPHTCARQAMIACATGRHERVSVAADLDHAPPAGAYSLLRELKSRRNF